MTINSLADKINRRAMRTAGSVLIAIMAAGAWAQQPASVTERTLKGQRLNELAAWSLGNDPVYRIYATDTAGNVTCFAADTLKPQWTQRISAESLTAPVIGDFMKTGAPILAFGSSNGGVHFLWPGTGELLASTRTDLSFVTAPSIAARSQGDELILADNSGYVAGFALTADAVVQETFRINNSTDDAAVIQGVGMITHPPASADINRDGQPEVILTSESGLVQVISLSADPAQPPTRYIHRIPQNTQASTLTAAGRFSQSSPSVFGFGIGSTLHFFTWNPEAQPKSAISPFLQAGAYGNSLGHLLIGEINADGAPDLLSTARSTVAARYLGLDLAGGETLLDITPNQLSTQNPPFSSAVPVTLKDGSKAVVAIDASGTAFVWEPTPQDNSPSRISDVPIPTAFTPAGDLTGDGKLSMVIWNEQTFTLSLATLPVDVMPATEAAPALTLGINYSRNGQWGSAWQRNYAGRAIRASDALKKAKAEAASTSDSNSTTDPISIVAGIDPADPLADRLKTPGDGFLSTGIMYPVGAIVIISLLIGTIYFLSRKKRRNY